MGYLLATRLNGLRRFNYACSTPLRLALVTAIVAASLASPVAGEDFLSTGDVATITGSTVGLFLLESLVGEVDSSDRAVIRGPLPLEASIVRFLGGTYRPGKSNFFDDTRGSVITPASFGLALFSVDRAWPRSDVGKESAQDMFLYISGLAATKATTGIAKGLFARPRPMMALEPELASTRVNPDYSFDNQSFFSGHTSSAFFSAAFLNLRMRAIMRTELSADDYRAWHWAPPAFLFGWASAVGVSRVHAYKHYPSDVLIGALAGYLLAELFYSFGDESAAGADEGNGATLMVSFSRRF